MNNKELLNKLEELSSIENLLDRMIKMQEFEKDYKKTEFYKQTKISLNDLLFTYRKDRFFDGDMLLKMVQNILDNISLDHLEHIISKLTDMFKSENEEVFEMIKSLDGIKL